MNNIAKFAIAAGVTVAVVGVGAAIAKKNKENSYINATPEETTETTESPLKRVVNNTMKKAVKFLAWVAVHQKELEAVATVLSVVAGIFGVINSVKEYSLGKKLHAKLDALDKSVIRLNRDFLDDRLNFISAWNSKSDNDITRYHNIMGALKPDAVPAN